MDMKPIRVLSLILLASTVLPAAACEKERPGESDEAAPEQPKPAAEPEHKAAPKPELTNLIKTSLAENDELDVVVSHVVIPPNFELPTHYHPGQEFVYVQQGTLTMKVKGKPDQSVQPGEAFIVPPEAVHTGVAEGGEVTAVVFRVHDRDKPVRYILKSDGEVIPRDQ